MQQIILACNGDPNCYSKKGTHKETIFAVSFILLIIVPNIVLLFREQIFISYLRFIPFAGCFIWL
jgi:hypothetical protein